MLKVTGKAEENRLKRAGECKVNGCFRSDRIPALNDGAWQNSYPPMLAMPTHILQSDLSITMPSNSTGIPMDMIKTNCHFNEGAGNATGGMCFAEIANVDRGPLCNFQQD